MKQFYRPSYLAMIKKNVIHFCIYKFIHKVIKINCIHKVAKINPALSHVDMKNSTEIL